MILHLWHVSLTVGFVLTKGFPQTFKLYVSYKLHFNTNLILSSYEKKSPGSTYGNLFYYVIFYNKNLGIEGSNQ